MLLDDPQPAPGEVEESPGVPAARRERVVLHGRVERAPVDGGRRQPADDHARPGVEREGRHAIERERRAHQRYPYPVPRSITTSGSGS